jgi:hypothetical protein
MTRYPDISDILAAKAAGRREVAKLSFGEKIAKVEALRERIQPLKAIRENAVRRDPQP